MRPSKPLLSSVRGNPRCSGTTGLPSRPGLCRHRAPPGSGAMGAWEEPRIPTASGRRLRRVRAGAAEAWRGRRDRRRAPGRDSTSSFPSLAPETVSRLHREGIHQPLSRASPAHTSARSRRDWEHEVGRCLPLGCSFQTLGMGKASFCLITSRNEVLLENYKTFVFFSLFWVWLAPGFYVHTGWDLSLWQLDVGSRPDSLREATLEPGEGLSG